METHKIFASMVQYNKQKKEGEVSHQTREY